MIIQELQNHFSTNFYIQNQSLIPFIHYFSIILINLIGYLYIFIKFFKVMCYSKMTFEWLPMINPYKWPFSFFQVLTDPYFRFWSKLFPTIRFQNSSMEISGIIALEALNSVLYVCIRLTQYLILILDNTEKLMTTSILI